MDTGVIIWIVSGVLFIALVMWLVSLAVKSGKKLPTPTTTPYDEQFTERDEPPSGSDAP